MKKEIAVAYFGSSTALAKALGLGKSSVSQWREVIPEKQALKLEKITGGKLKYDPGLYQDKVA